MISEYNVNMISDINIPYCIISNTSGRTKLCLNDIQYIEVHDHTLHYHTESGCFSSTTSMTIKRLADKLSVLGFARCHHGYLVNLSHINGYHKNSIYVGDSILPLSRTYKKRFLNSLNALWNSISIQ